MLKKELIIVRGLPGSGKSTFANMLGRAICTADDFHTDRNGNYNWKEENVALAHAWCKRKCERFMKINMNRVIVANTSVTEWEITPYLNLAKKYGYTVFSIIVENRHGNSSIHNVPIETLERMKSKFDICL